MATRGCEGGLLSLFTMLSMPWMHTQPRLVQLQVRTAASDVWLVCLTLCVLCSAGKQAQPTHQRLQALGVAVVVMLAM